jgi:HK97 family phage prohead protease
LSALNDRQVANFTCRCGQAYSVRSGEEELETKAARPGDRTALSLELKSVDPETRIIEGYASTPHVDKGGDIVEAGAPKFKDPADVQAYVGHQHMIGALPVGIPLEVRYEGDRLYTKTRIHKTTAGDDLLAVAAERAAIGKPLGMSIGYPPSSVVAKYEQKDGRMVRRISSLELKEYSFTAMPMNDQAQVIAVKALADMSAEDRRAEIESAIRDRSLPGEYSYVFATYDAYVITREDDNSYRRYDYTIAADGTVTLGLPIEVVQTWTPKLTPDVTDTATSIVTDTAKSIAGLLDLELALAAA